MQQDQHSLLYRDFRSVLDVLSPLSERGKQWKDRLLKWDGNLSTASQEATLFEAWYTELTRLPAREVGQEFWDEPRYILAALRSGDKNCDQPDTEFVESCLDFAALALDKALDRFGDKVPTWGSLHHAVFDHAILTNSPLKRFSDRQVAFGGDRYTVNVGPYDEEKGGFEMSHGPSYRHIVDLSNPQNSLFVHPMGQSGSLLSGEYSDYLSKWQRGEYFPMKTKGYGLKDRLMLEPLK